MEKILSIEEKEDFESNTWCNLCGYIIVTDKQTIKLGITNSQDCCENFSYFISEDDISEFINSNLLDIKITDTQLKEKEGFNQNNLDEGGVMFVDIITDIGVLQFVAYNEHNGYYGHEACVISKQLNHKETL